ncbi:MAG: hypothetical protein B6241_07880 [Spirochaetaceae bacterium 4572_59]|nr:MAG: hypothetical protein B6241_07880 [Spirochaetaceae bacterium 4572_59]
MLDATLGQGVSINASAIVADTINEQFVKSSGFTAIDRAYVSSVQEEKKFQLSGDVNELDIKEIGNTFGAEYLCVANVSLLGSTYTVSARLIEVSTAEVYAQESHRMKGEIDILFMVAEIVGAELVGSDLKTVVTVPLKDTPAVVEAPPEPQVLPEPKPPRPKKEYTPGKSRPHLMVSWLFPNYAGAEDSTYSLYEQDEYLLDSGYDSAEANHIGIDIHYMQPILNILYYSMGFSYTKQTLIAEDSFNTYEVDNFITMEPYFGLDLRYKYAKSGEITGAVIFTEDYEGDRSFGHHGFMIGLGFMF